MSRSSPNQTLQQTAVHDPFYFTLIGPPLLSWYVRLTRGGGMEQPKFFSRRALCVVLFLVFIGLGIIYFAYFAAQRSPSKDELICEAQYVADKFFVPVKHPRISSPTYRVEHPESDRWLVSGETDGDTGDGTRALHPWTAVLERISIGRIECVELHIDGQRVMKLDPEFLRSPNSRYHSGPRPRCSGS